MEKKKNGFLVKDFFIDGQIQMAGIFKDKKMKKHIGEFIWYFENGNVNQKGRFVNNEKEGEWNWYFENGNIDRKGSYVKNERQGEWKWYFENGQASSIEEYIEGERVKAQFFNQEGKEISQEEGEYNPGSPSRKDSLSYLLETLGTYPEEARIANIKGPVVVRILVGKTGEIERKKLLQKQHPILNEEALRVVSLLPPSLLKAKEHGRRIKYWLNIPVKFKLKR
ncbi:MAG: TonB family protein [Bacteroidota bacterium]